MSKVIALGTYRNAAGTLQTREISHTETGEDRERFHREIEDWKSHIFYTKDLELVCVQILVQESVENFEGVTASYQR